jgi:hypothetical protein
MHTDPVYAVARSVAPTVAAHLARHRADVEGSLTSVASGVPLPDADVVGVLLDAAFWASLRREEGYVPTISLAYLPPTPDVHPLTFARPLSLDAASLARLGPAVERPGIHLGVWHNGDGLKVWGTTRTIPPFCFVVEVIAPGLIVLKHRPREQSHKFVNLAVIEGDTAKIVDGTALVPECPALLAGPLGGDPHGPDGDTVHVLIQLAVSMRAHRRGGMLLVVPPNSRAWEQSIVTPISYAIEPAFSELAALLARGDESDAASSDAIRRTVTAIAGLTAVDGATVMTHDYDLLAFGAKIRRRQGAPQVEQLLLTEPVIGNLPLRVTPAQMGGTRHLSAAQFISDQKEGMALVASQDGRFTLFAWSPVEELVHAHRVDSLLL